MTTDPTSPVADLEQRVAAAADELARLQAELGAARAADPSLPDVPTPYDGQAPVVTINGQEVPATQSFTIPPVISVNGQVVSGGQPVDLAAFMGPAAAQQVASVLTQFGVNLGGLMGAHATNAANAGYAAGMSAPPVTAQSAPLPYAGTPGEIRPNNAWVRWLAALVVLGSLALIIYLSIAN